ncbi:MAG: glycoside hydrolase family 9 protein, partial [Planctomycetes bacterium]|nr:glycoside hydrolase family 9 protein [Planctomycetota bacterium]
MIAAKLKSVRLVGSLAICCVFGLYLASAAPARAAEGPFFVDLRPVANAALEDDGLAGNGKGGWTDQGINDMYLWPPLAVGENVYNGYPFRVIDPDKNDGKAAILLKGSALDEDKPLEATAKVPAVRGKYIFIMHSTLGAGEGEPPNFRVATYTVAYKDGTTEDIAIRNEMEIRNWGFGEFQDPIWDPLCWPVHHGANMSRLRVWASNMIWATRWENPHPDKPITAIQFKSTGKSAFAVFAVTISDTDYAAQRKEPAAIPPVPAGYFDKKGAQEDEHLFKFLVQEGQAKGLRRLEVIRNDLLAVTLDPALTHITKGLDIAQEAQKPETFTIQSPTDPEYEQQTHPVKVGRLSYEAWNGDIGPSCWKVLYWHTYYLYLPEPLAPGNDYTVAVSGLEPRFRSSDTLHYDDKETIVRTIKINQVAYSALSKRRYAYLGWWAGDAGKVDYSGCKRFRIVDEATGKAALEGPITLRQADDPLSGEDVYQMDLSALGPGRYHVYVPGLGRSDSFEVDGAGIHDLYYHTTRAFFHQRCGQEFREPWTDIKKPACHVWCWESGHLLEEKNYKPKPGEKKKAFYGGYHDAADFDTFTRHLSATAQMLNAYEKYPEAFKDADLNLPESGDGIPDVLDEARWGLSFYLDNQRPDG